MSMRSAFHPAELPYVEAAVAAVRAERDPACHYRKHDLYDYHGYRECLGQRGLSAGVPSNDEKERHGLDQELDAYDRAY